jgi:hypothetical protein
VQARMEEVPSNSGQIVDYDYVPTKPVSYIAD